MIWNHYKEPKSFTKPISRDSVSQVSHRLVSLRLVSLSLLAQSTKFVVIRLPMRVELSRAAFPPLFFPPNSWKLHGEGSRSANYF